MRGLVQDLGDLTGLDIMEAARCAGPVGDAAARSARPPVSTILALRALRWLGLAPGADGRCRPGGCSDAGEARTPRFH